MSKEKKLTEITRHEFEESYTDHIRRLKRLELKSTNKLEQALEVYIIYKREERENIIRYYVDAKGNMLYEKYSRDTIGFKYDNS